MTRFRVMSPTETSSLVRTAAMLGVCLGFGTICLLAETPLWRAAPLFVWMAVFDHYARWIEIRPEGVVVRSWFRRTVLSPQTLRPLQLDLWTEGFQQITLSDGDHRVTVRLREGSAYALQSRIEELRVAPPEAVVTYR